jgi:hypothetical protein
MHGCMKDHWHRMHSGVWSMRGQLHHMHEALRAKYDTPAQSMIDKRGPVRNIYQKEYLSKTYLPHHYKNILYHLKGAT